MTLEELTSVMNELDPKQEWNVITGMNGEIQIGLCLTKSHSFKSVIFDDINLSTKSIIKDLMIQILNDIKHKADKMVEKLHE